jgi:aerobic carbon-monoxide dehydrogenase large subunit
MKFGIGQSVKRVEDVRLVTGQGRYTDDIAVDGMVYAATLRSPYGHARIRSIDTSAAQAHPGVLLVVTAADITGYRVIAPMMTPKGMGSDYCVDTPRPLLASDTVRYVGEGVAFIVATSREAARAASELVDVDYDELPAVGSIEVAMAEGAATVWPEAKGNIAYDWSSGNKAETDAAFASAKHVVSVRVVHNRIAPTSMEVRAALGQYEEERGFTLTMGGQGVAGMRMTTAGIMKESPDRVRVITPDVGGGFGMKMFFYPEYALVLHAARVLGKPVKWTGERSDAFQSDTHGRDLIANAELALDGDGNFLGLRSMTYANGGAYHGQFGSMVQTFAGGRMLGGVYRLPAIFNRVKGVVTNSSPVDAYRGAGRPEATYTTERLVEAAARQIGIPADELRRRNLLTSAELPHTTPLGVTYDVGDYPGLLARALETSDSAGFEARRTAAARRGRILGRGLAFYCEICAFGDAHETADVRFLPNGTVEVAIGTQSNGQGHETAYAQIFAEKLQVPMESVRIVQGDTDRLEVGGGTGGSRSVHLGGAAALVAAQDVLTAAMPLAAADLGVTEGEIDYADGVFRARPTNRATSLFELAQKHPGSLNVRGVYSKAAPTPTYPNGCHVCEVEVDPETGALSMTRYSVVDDFGTLVNPLLVQGQVHGGVVQGLGQAIIENVVYGEGAQLVTGSFMDYGIPRADDIPHISFESRPVPNPNNPIGMKGCGEAGTIGATPAVVNAVNDALARAGAGEVEMPLTPEKLWSALQAVRRAAE